MEDISRKTMIKLSSLMHTGLASRFCRIFGTHSWKQCNGEKTCGMWTMGHADQWPLTSLRSSELWQISELLSYLIRKSSGDISIHVQFNGCWKKWIYWKFKNLKIPHFIIYYNLWLSFIPQGAIVHHYDF